MISQNYSLQNEKSQIKMIHNDAKRMTFKRKGVDFFQFSNKSFLKVFFSS